MPIVGPDRLDEVVDALRRGDVAAIPTDTVYGLAARADDPSAVRHLAELKGRDPRQPIAVLFDDMDMIRRHIERSDAFDRLSAFWPGPLTLVVRARPGTAAALATSEAGTVGIRQPGDDLARAVIRGAGGVLAVTSANRTGEPPATAAAAVAAIFGPQLLVLDGGPRSGTASTVVDLTVAPPVVLRPGPLSAEQLGLTAQDASPHRR